MKTEITPLKKTLETLSPLDINLIEFVMNQVNDESFYTTHDIHKHLVEIRRGLLLRSHTPDIVSIQNIPVTDSPQGMEYCLRWYFGGSDSFHESPTLLKEETDTRSLSKVKKWMKYSERLSEREDERSIRQRDSSQNITLTGIPV